MARITAVQITGVKIIRYCNVEFDATSNKPICLSGKNGSGKSSFIDALTYAFTKERPIGMIRNGLTSANIQVYLSNDMTINTTLSGERADNVVIHKDGVLVSNSRDILNTMGSAFVDPGYLTGLSGKDLWKYLVQKSGIDFTELDQKIAKASEERTIAGRAVRAFGDITRPERPRLERLDMRQKVSENDEMQATLTALTASISTANTLLKLRDTCLIVLSKIDDLQLPDERLIPHDLTQALEIESLWNEYDQLERTYQDYLAAEAYKLDCESKLDTLRQEKQDLMRKLSWTGAIDIREDAIYVHSVLWDSLSSGQKIRYACDIALQNLGELRVWFVRNAALLDEDALSHIIEVAESYDIQLFLEVLEKPETETECLSIVEGVIDWEGRMNGVGGA